MIPAIKQTLESIRKHYSLFTISTIIEILFFYFLTRLHIEIFKSAAVHIKQAQNIIQGQITKLTQTEYSQFDKVLLSNADFAAQYHQIVKYIGLFLLLFFLLWFLLRGLNWLIAHKIAGTKIKLKTFILRFTLFSITGFALFVLLLIFYGSMINYATFNPLPLINTKIANTTFFVLTITLHYFVSTGFALTGKKIITSIKTTLPAYLLINLLLATLILIPAVFTKTSFWTSILTILFVTFPAIIFARILFTNVVNK
ncbi:hypothetical protein HY485_04375 [Candidatus Woesearchaeota archaeon]|nr:hypothetical protein [Candidatus Woesearchaeota archaeon]